MVEYAKILFPVDLTEQSRVVAEHAATMVEKFGAELHLVHVIPRYEGPTFSSVRDLIDEIKHDVLNELKKVTAAFFFSADNVQEHVLVGHTGRQILNYIEKHDISMVVMGTHGRSGLGNVFFGSVAQRVVQNAKIPILTVHPGPTVRTA